MKYLATASTLLKKAPVQGSTLPEDQKVNVSKGKTYGIRKVIESDGLHSHVELESGSGSWWIFLPHWDIGNSNPVSSPAPSNIITAVFTLKQAKTSELIDGSLTFFENGEEKLKVVATSGAAGYQYAGAHSVRGKGCLPPAKDWKISTSGYYLATKGVEGNFYHITPDPRAGRGEIGLHRDANVPGSSGCIVVRGANTFNNKVAPLIDKLKYQQPKITLSVIYT